MPKLTINDQEIEVAPGTSIIQAAEQIGVEIPRFCYHDRLSVPANCRMCLVEVEGGPPKPVASCAMACGEGMVVKTDSPMVKKARKGVMEMLLINHPLDCPICDQGGECDLQDQSLYYGFDKSRFKENKREVKDKYMGPLIKTQMTRCIHCTRCVRFATEVAGVTELGAIGRGENMQITTYLEKAMESELSANVIDLCPVGALTSKPYVFEARPWELKKTESIDVMDAIGSNIRIDTYGWEVKRILPKINDDINEEWISDKTRYACDGLKNQRLDTPYFKDGDEFKKISWKNAYEILVKKINKTSPEKIACFTGDLTNMETMYVAKEFFDKTIKSKNLESRSDHVYVNSNIRSNYIFNSKINGIEESDIIILVGTNPRYEATILNARIRKSFLKNNTEIYSVGDVGDLTYPYKVLSNSTKIIKEICENDHELSNKIINAKKPMIIIGQSALKLKSGKYIFENIKNFLVANKKINDEWNSLNIISENASTVGGYDLDLLSSNNGKNITLEEMQKNNFEIIFFLNQDNINFKKQNEFIIYIGSHGDRGAEFADLILPGAAYTEQEGHYTNLEGKIQKAFQATYPPGNAKEDWEILNDLSELLKRKKIFKNKDELIDSLMNYLNLKKNIKEATNVLVADFIEEKISLDLSDYYYSNVIARASKTMSECRNIKIESKKTGTEI